MSHVKPDVREIFCEAMDRDSPDAVAAYLDGACCGDAQLRAQVENLLRAYREAGNFMRNPSSSGEPTLDSPAVYRPGTNIGPYKLREQIGEGGFGVVFVADQEKPIRRKVALKVIKPGMDTKDVIARFEAERQALALMDHPNVAHVLDAGTTDSGHPFFVMELVHGIPITQFCDRKKLPTRERLRLFTDVCRAVQHAHQKGIIHRDLKPSNIMVTLHDGVPVPKVIDFGVSKALSQQLSEKTIYTAYGQMIGTPAYMSPEQAEMSGLGIDTRSDIYSLGVLLYELLTGKTPIDAKRLREGGLAEILRIIRDEEPLCPSLKISTLGEEATEIAQHRQSDPQQLRHDIRGELDWIAMKCLEKDRSRRYETAVGLARDVERYLKDEPVEACPPNMVYRLRKFARKHRLALAMSAVIAGVLVTSSVASSMFAWNTNVARHEERSAKEKTQQALGQQQIATRNAEAAEAIAEQHAREYRRQLYFTDMNLAGENYRQANIARVLELLNRHDPRMQADSIGEDLRGFEWYHLKQLCQRSLDAKTIELPYDANEVEYSPDGRFLAVGLANRTCVLYRCQPDDTLEKIGGYGPGDDFWERMDVDFSSDSRNLFFPSGKGDVTQLDLVSGKAHFVFKGHQDWVSNVAISPDGKHLATGSLDGRIWLWDLETRQLKERLFENIPRLEGQYPNVAFSFDSRLLGYCYGDSEIVVRDLSDQDAEVLRFSPSSIDAVPRGHKGVYCMQFAPERPVLATGHTNGQVYIWDCQRGSAPIAVLRGHTDELRSVGFSADGTVLATGGRDNRIMLWDTRTWEQRDVLLGHGSTVHTRISPDGTTLASVSMDRSLKLWKLDRDHQLSFWRTDNWILKSAYCDTIQGVVFTQRHDMMTSQITRGQLTRIEDRPDDPIVRLAAGAHGKLAVLRRSGMLEVVSLPGLQLLFSSPGALDVRIYVGNEGQQVGISMDGRWVASGRRGDVVELFDLNKPSSDPVAFHTKGGVVHTLAFSPDGNELAIGSVDGVVEIWRLSPTLAPPTFVQSKAIHRSPVMDLCYSPDGQRMATGGWDRMVTLWSRQSDGVLSPSGPFQAHTLQVSAVLFSPDGKSLFSAGGDHMIRIWDVESGQLRFTLYGHTAAVHTIALSEDGRTLYSGGRDRIIRKWTAAPAEIR